MILAGLVSFTLAVHAPQTSRVDRFLSAYRSRGSDWVRNGVDPAIKTAIFVIQEAVVEGLRRNPDASEKEVTSWLKPFQTAIGAKPGDPQDYRSIDASATVIDGWRFANFQMGGLVRTVAFDGKGKTIALPNEFDWNTSWLSVPTGLPHGLVLMQEASLPAQGNCVPERLVWLKVDGRKASVVGTFEGTTTLDYEGAEVRNGRVSVKTMDEPLALEADSASMFLLERDTSWDCTRGRPRRIKSQPKQLALRSLDRAIFNAWHSDRPTKVQVRLLQFLPKGTRAQLSRWTERNLPNGQVRIRMNGEMDFFLQRVGSGLSLVGVTATPGVRR